MSILLLSSVVLLASCATPYKQAGLMGGFHESQLSADTFMVTFQGNGYTRDDRARDFLLLRCADITLAHGMKFFRVVGAADGSRGGAVMAQNGNVGYVGLIHFPNQTATIQVRQDSEGPQDFDAAIVSKSMRDSYGIK